MSTLQQHLFTQLNYFSSAKRPEYPVFCFCQYRRIIFSNYPLKRAEIAEGVFQMKKTFKLFWIIVLLAVVGFSMAACGGDDGSSDPFEGTWLGSAVGVQIMQIAASNGTWMFQTMDGDFAKGTYTISENTINLKTAEVNPVLFGGTGSWVSYSDLSSAQKATVVQKGFSENFTITLNGNTFTYWGDKFTKL
jgi:hypothetical protein